MSNNKQSSIEWLIEHYTFADLTAESWEMIRQQAKAMHKEEIIAAHFNAQPFNGTMLNNAEQYYNQTFGDESNS
jgi:uncharacterized membrane protein YozB (DUF420 family)